MYAWLTPNVSQFSLDKDCRCIKVPGDLWYLVSGALQLLAESSNWETFGTATPGETAEYFQGVIEEYTNSMCNQIGQLGIFVGSLPAGWLSMDGSTYTQAQYPSLYDAVPSSWKAGSNFTLPDMELRSVVGFSGEYDKGGQGGAQTVALTVQQLATHAHTYQKEVSDIIANGELLPTTVSGIATANAVTGNAGQGQPHNNMPPYLIVEFGIFAGYV